MLDFCNSSFSFLLFLGGISLDAESLKFASLPLSCPSFAFFFKAPVLAVLAARPPFVGPAAPAQERGAQTVWISRNPELSARKYRPPFPPSQEVGREQERGVHAAEGGSCTEMRSKATSDMGGPCVSPPPLVLWVRSPWEVELPQLTFAPCPATKVVLRWGW